MCICKYNLLKVFDLDEIIKHDVFFSLLNMLIGEVFIITEESRVEMQSYLSEFNRRYQPLIMLIFIP